MVAFDNQIITPLPVTGAPTQVDHPVISHPLRLAIRVKIRRNPEFSQMQSRMAWIMLSLINMVTVSSMTLPSWRLAHWHGHLLSI
jgi:hypothetical protein